MKTKTNTRKISENRIGYAILYSICSVIAGIPISAISRMELINDKNINNFMFAIGMLLSVSGISLFYLLNYIFSEFEKEN